MSSRSDTEAIVTGMRIVTGTTGTPTVPAVTTAGVTIAIPATTAIASRTITAIAIPAITAMVIPIIAGQE